MPSSKTESAFSVSWVSWRSAQPRLASSAGIFALRSRAAFHSWRAAVVMAREKKNVPRREWAGASFELEGGAVFVGAGEDVESREFGGAGVIRGGCGGVSGFFAGVAEQVDDKRIV